MSLASLSLPKLALLFSAGCVAATCSAARPAAAFQLITAAEAALPPRTIPATKERSPTRLPRITVLSPSGIGAVYSPFDLKLRFSAFGGAAIDPDSVVLTYIKQPDIDITSRIRSFITANGIEIANADVPAGMHQFWIQLTDTDGRSAGREFDVQVVK